MVVVLVSGCSSSHVSDDTGTAGAGPDAAYDAGRDPAASDAGPRSLVCPDWFPREYHARVDLVCRPETGPGLRIIATPDPRDCDDMRFVPRLEMIGFSLPTSEGGAWYTERMTGSFLVCDESSCESLSYPETASRWSFDENREYRNTGFTHLCGDGRSVWGSSSPETTVWCGPREIACP
jgi:hypothetical protein